MSKGAWNKAGEPHGRKQKEMKIHCNSMKTYPEKSRIEFFGKRALHLTQVVSNRLTIYHVYILFL